MEESLSTGYLMCQLQLACGKWEYIDQLLR